MGNYSEALSGYASSSQLGSSPVWASLWLHGVTVRLPQSPWLPHRLSGARASRVTIGSPSGQTPENHQNEPAIAMDAHNPDVLVAGVNDFIESPTVSPVHRNPTGKVRGPARRNNPRYRSLWCAESAPRIPERLRSGRRVEVRFASSINLSGQSRFIKSFFSTIPPLFSTSTRSVSKTFGVSGIGGQCTAIPPGRYRP